MFTYQDDEKQNQFQKILKLMDENSSNLNKLSKSLDESEKADVIKIMNDLLKNMILFFTSQELITWVKTKPKTLTMDQLAEIAKQRMEEIGK